MSTSFLRCNADNFITVRTQDGILLGCIPGAAVQQAGYLQTTIGQVEVRMALVYALVPTPEQVAQLDRLEGFTPFNPTAFEDTAIPIVEPVRDAHEP